MPKSSEFLYDPKTGKLWREAGCADGRGYRHVQFQGRLQLEHRVAWFLYYGEWPDKFVDHINGNPSDNRIVNLRLATPSENGYNRGMSRNNTTGFKGVSRQRGRWQSLISVDGKNKFLGLFDTPEEAADAYNDAAVKHHGNFAKVDGNYPLAPRSARVVDIAGCGFRSIREFGQTRSAYSWRGAAPQW